MEIKIDTKRDSVEDIKKTIDFLLKFVDHDHNTDSGDVPTVGKGAFNIFGDTSSDTPTDNYDSYKSKDDDNDDEPVTIVEY
ncbi:hypothetical protein ACFLTH_05590 [Bacteroidota bacterium]